MAPRDRDAPTSGETPDERTSLSIHGFAAGGRVDRTGIALVHEGEYIVPAPGSEARISSLAGESPSGHSVNYFFPVEIEVVGALSESHVQQLVDRVFDQLDTALRSRR